MKSNTVTFKELASNVINQLKSQKYMDSTLVIYRRIYSRIHVFLNGKHSIMSTNKRRNRRNTGDFI